MWDTGRTAKLTDQEFKTRQVEGALQSILNWRRTVVDEEFAEANLPRPGIVSNSTTARPGFKITLDDGSEWWVVASANRPVEYVDGADEE